jgi:capsular polysaccharide export protein
VAEDVVAALRREQVGGSFWAAPADLLPGCALILVPDDAAQLAAMMRETADATFTVILPPSMTRPPGAAILPPDFDPWHVAGQASAVWAGSRCELATVAALLGKPVRLFAGGGAASTADDSARLIEALLDDLSATAWSSPFTGDNWTIEQTIAPLGEWRRLILANREFRAIFGVALWKRVTLDPLLWDGTGPVRHVRRIPASLGPGTRVLAWQSRPPCWPNCAPAR